MKIISKEDLIIRESMKLPYGGGEIWCYKFIDDYEKAKEWLIRER
jgi:hypothetical protein